ncbi:2-aminoadipate transaminase [Saezia sanguinis]|uniref:2-aminoadipate transaminase n=1 Tax=Saezia sanguinis TaxID=1965230 RepID=A0A433SC19_9BURK|nr:PLP-dependent aminotransferase family protein [Saezia sanguinis]RUS66269.1 2-aminoadipate transaminase [Saezia sanguinis]
MLTRTSSQTLTEQLVNRYTWQIQEGVLLPGARLPSVRECARRHGVSPYTVVAAYDQLQAQGLVEARKQRGFYVRDVSHDLQHNHAAHNRSSANSADVHAPVNAVALIRGMMQPWPGFQDRPMPGSGALPVEWLENSFLGMALRRASSAKLFNDMSLRYGEPAGDRLLREMLAHRLAQYDVVAHADQIVTTIGATQALDIITRTLLQSGDAVMVEEPGWSVEFARLVSLGMRVLPVPRGPQGPDLSVVQHYCEEFHPRLYVSVSVLHNPTGTCLSPMTAHQMLQLAQQYDFYIAEDDTYASFAPAHMTRVSVLDGLVRTIYVGGFSKILAPNWRVGYLAAAPALVDRLIATKLISTLTTPSLMERALAYSLEQGQVRRHAERLRERLDAARVRSVRLAEKAGCQFIFDPAGLFGWVDTGVDTAALAQRMADMGWLLAPGALFMVNSGASTYMRINFATSQDARFWQDFERARDAMCSKAPQNRGKVSP